MAFTAFRDRRVDRPSSPVEETVSDAGGDDEEEPPPADAVACKCYGTGLETASTRQHATFTIDAYTEYGDRKKTGGDPFVVSIRGRGEKVRSKLIDHGTGKYTVGFKPYQSGKLMIGVSLHGTSLPGSPFTCRVCNPEASAPCCVVRGLALTSAIARTEQSFDIQFRDSMGNVAHAEELNVYVEEFGQDGGEQAIALTEGSRRGTAGSALNAPDAINATNAVNGPKAAHAGEAGTVAEGDAGEGGTVAGRAPNTNAEDFMGGLKRAIEGSVDCLPGAPAVSNADDDGADEGRSAVGNGRSGDDEGGGHVATLRTAECSVTSRKPLILRESAELESPRIGQVQPGERLVLLDVVMAHDGGEQCVRASVARANPAAPSADSSSFDAKWRSVFTAKPAWLQSSDIRTDLRPSPTRLLLSSGGAPRSPSRSPHGPKLGKAEAVAKAQAQQAAGSKAESEVKGEAVVRGEATATARRLRAAPQVSVASAAAVAQSPPVNAAASNVDSPTSSGGATGNGSSPWTCAPRTWSVGVAVKPPPFTSPQKGPTSPGSAKPQPGTVTSAWRTGPYAAAVAISALQSAGAASHARRTTLDGVRTAPTTLRAQHAASPTASRTDSLTSGSPPIRSLVASHARASLPEPPAPAPVPIGWVTVYKGGRELVTARSILDAGERQRHMQQWARRLAVDRSIAMANSPLLTAAAGSAKAKAQQVESHRRVKKRDEPPVNRHGESIYTNGACATPCRGPAPSPCTSHRHRSTHRAELCYLVLPRRAQSSNRIHRASVSPLAASTLAGCMRVGSWWKRTRLVPGPSAMRRQPVYSISLPPPHASDAAPVALGQCMPLHL